MTEQNDKPQQEHLSAYDRMLHRVREFLEDAEEKTAPIVDRALENAIQTATDLGELTREEAEKIGEYLKRDLHDAAIFLEGTGEELGEWLRFDLALIEDRLVDMFLSVADKTRIELAQLAERATRVGEWHTGEITGIGTLQCKECGEELHFHKTSHIPPCPKCHGTRFRRLYSGE